MSNYQHGHDAEARAADYLQNIGYVVAAMNWKTKFCEIDIVANKGRCMYFVEVKYRQQSYWGEALEYITPKKLRQMRFAAAMWVHQNNWQKDYQLAAIGMDQEQFNFVLIED